MRSRGEEVFDLSLDAIREAIALRFQSDSIRDRIARELRTAPSRPKPEPHPIIPNKLSRREIEVLRLIVDGLTTIQISAKLGLAFKTAAAHRSHIMSKLDVNNSAAMVREAFRLGIPHERLCVVDRISGEPAEITGGVEVRRELTGSGAKAAMGGPYD
ncbi:MAG TPA: LuxR C-terminal-related transcriptional regulator [Verrucomicrobiae bacterium]|nr:LuxR C-terminal-related transcriptional regulator [Verrucomicrobiae bacterium]